MNEFNANPQLGKIVQNLEHKHDNSMARQFGKKTTFTMKPELFKMGNHEGQADGENEKVRTRKFKKPLNTMASRRERIEMVKGLAYQMAEGAAAGAQGKDAERAKKNFMAVEEETDSKLTHEEIEECAKRYNLTSWQQVFALDAEFWSLITVEQEEKKKAEAKKLGGPGDDDDFLTQHEEDDDK